MNRRELLSVAGVGGMMFCLPTGGDLASQLKKEAKPVKDQTPPSPFRYCLNTSTIREAKLSLPALIDLTAEAGYDGIEPWIREIDSYIASGGSMKDLRQRLVDKNLRLESAIGFPKWAVDDAGERKKGFEEAKRGMELVRQLGGDSIAAPPIGVHQADAGDLDLDAAGERYHQLLELGKSIGVTPQLEIWGASKNLSTLKEAVYVAAASGHPDASLLLDIYHLYRGGSGFDGLRLLSKRALKIIHFNDYPKTSDRKTLTDADRVYPGDGVAPFSKICKQLKSIDFEGVLSLELFNRTYWKQDPVLVAKKGLLAMKKACSESDC